MANEVYAPEIAEFIRNNITGTTIKDLTRMLNEQFGKEYSESKIKAYVTNHKLRSGIDCRFKPGRTPHNKGKKGVQSPGCEKGWFSKGHTPHNHAPVGTEVITTDGYLKVKIAEPNVWKLKHVLVWEAANGPVPKGKALLFLDGNHENTALENLTLITRAELARLNQSGLIKSNAELTKSGVLTARLKNEIGNAKRKRKSK